MNNHFINAINPIENPYLFWPTPQKPTGVKHPSKSQKIRSNKRKAKRKAKR